MSHAAAANSSSDHTKTAASARSTWPSTSPTTARSTGPSLKRRWSSSTRFLDDVVSANKYVPAVPQLQDAAHRVRRIGLGIMGLADVMYRLGVRYGDQELLDLAGQVMEFVRYHCMRTSIDLARERGPFLAIEGSIYDPNNLKWQPPTPLQPYTHEFGRPAVDWDAIVEGIKATWHPQRRTKYSRANRNNRHGHGLRRLRLRAGLRPGLYPLRQGSRRRRGTDVR